MFLSQERKKMITYYFIKYKKLSLEQENYTTQIQIYLNKYQLFVIKKNVAAFIILKI